MQRNSTFPGTIYDRFVLREIKEWFKVVYELLMRGVQGEELINKGAFNNHVAHFSGFEKSSVIFPANFILVISKRPPHSACLIFLDFYDRAERYSQYVSVVSLSIVSCFNFEFFFPIFIPCVRLWLRSFCLSLDCFQRNLKMYFLSLSYATSND